MRRQTLEVNARIYDFFYLAASAFLKGACLFCVKVVEVWSKTDMGEDRRGRVSYVIGPDGSPLTLADLPPPNTKRWVIRRKAEVVALLPFAGVAVAYAVHRRSRRPAG